MKRADSPRSARRPSPATETESPALPLNPSVFRSRLMPWYRLHARQLPWRGTTDPYRIWVSEIMLQQTRVAAVIDHYNEFLRRFPSLLSLALAPEPDVLAAWSGLGYYRRARMLHKAAQFIMLEREGHLPATASELRTLPGIGEYTAAAIASIAFSENVAVVDGNVERVILRLTGRLHDAAGPRSASARAFIQLQARGLLPPTLDQPIELDPAHPTIAKKSSRHRPARAWDTEERIALAAAADPGAEAADPHLAATSPDPGSIPRHNPAGDHNQAMMELGATICLPRAPLCLQCPVYALCATRGEHPVPVRAAQLSRPVAYLLDLRKRGTSTEVLLERRPDEASLMPGMYELPPLPIDAVEGREPVLRVRHSITNTNYYVQVFAPHHTPTRAAANRSRSEAQILRRAVPSNTRDLHWVRAARLPGIPITGLARKILQRLDVMESPRLNVLE